MGSRSKYRPPYRSSDVRVYYASPGEGPDPVFTEIKVEKMDAAVESLRAAGFPVSRRLVVDVMLRLTDTFRMDYKEAEEKIREFLVAMSKATKSEPPPEPLDPRPYPKIPPKKLILNQRRRHHKRRRR